ncbi:hypothetical protein MAC_05633 [Metarhizium acridum CQMa 102]|uniref:Uncharacterized protein n=1 Tax=Metarhizium acridum (strain CQMa 102) TaxID=655827 RepID=E9E6Z7_METAQ|nr:uncharacterized protein MAC_05633 [Metarhizium acridum CQMa 102]EFY88292.1 hypothetical protein MAC_05633 [Metarhizium acridum CQMa 102]
MAAQVLDSKAARRQPSTPAALPPEYAEGDHVELADLSTPRTSTAESPPAYDEVVSPAALATTGLAPTHTYQVESEGHPLIALPLAPRPSPVGIFAVLPDGSLGPLAYQSLRRARCSGNSVLVRADDPLALEPLCSTTMRLQGEVAHGEELEVAGEGWHTRAHNMRTHLGTFQWRYAGRRERRAVGASSLLVMDQITSVALLGGKTAERRRRVAQLVRSEALRTPGTTGATAGNGGRLLMDLSAWAGSKAEVRAMEVLVLSGCVVMLKKEVDRRRAAQFVVLAGAAGGSIIINIKKFL